MTKFNFGWSVATNYEYDHLMRKLKYMSSIIIICLF